MPRAVKILDNQRKMSGIRNLPENKPLHHNSNRLSIETDRICCRLPEAEENIIRFNAYLAIFDLETHGTYRLISFERMKNEAIQ